MTEQHDPNIIFSYPDYQKDVERQYINLGLELYKRLPYLNEMGRRKQNDKILEWIARPGINFNTDYVNKRYSEYNEYLKFLSGQGLSCYSVTLHQVTPAIIGDVNNSAEFGISLDRNSGVPMIAASSIRGCVRLSYMVNVAKKNNEVKVDPEEMDLIFGSLEREGLVVFSDCFLFSHNSAKCFKLEINNPHNSGGYFPDGKSYPDEKTDPVPVKYLSVGSPENNKLKWKTSFFFRVPIGYRIGDFELTKDVIEDIKTAYMDAFSNLGVGGKTSMGYGRFDIEITELKVDGKAEENIEAVKTETQSIVSEPIEAKTIDTICECIIVKVKKDFIQIEIDGVRYKINQSLDVKRNDRIMAHVMLNEANPSENKIKVLERIGQ